MLIFRRHKLSIVPMLVLLILSGVLPAFGSPGAWLCPDGSACPWMNGGAKTAKTSQCKQNSSHPCCICPGKKPPTTVTSPLKCRYVPAVTRHVSARAIAVEPTVERTPSPLLTPLSPDDPLQVFRQTALDFPLPLDCPIPSTPLSSATSSRAPPLG
jgi:hypothetical protein